MAEALQMTTPSAVSRRGFLKRVAVGAAALALYTFISRRPFGFARGGHRPIPAGLPGAGSIFQPRNDRRSSR